MPRTALDNLKENFAAYLIPEDEQKRKTELAQMIETLSKASTNFYNLEKVDSLLWKALEDQHTILADGQNLKKEEYDRFYKNLYQIYDLVQLNDAGKMVVDGEMRQDITGDEAEFPVDLRGPKDFVSNLQKLWTFLKVCAEIAAETKEIYAEEILQEFQETFTTAYNGVENQAVEEVQNAYRAAEDRRKQEERQAKVKDMFGRLEEYLLPETEEQQLQELEQMSDIIRESVIDAGSGDRERFLNDFREILKDYNQLKNHKEQQVDYKNLYTRLYNKIYYRMQLDQGNLKEQFPENTRNAEDFVMNVQKAWIFLKGFTKIAKDDKQLLNNVATYAGYFNEHEFAASYKEAVKADKQEKLNKIINTYKEARDNVVNAARIVARDSYDDFGTKGLGWNSIADNGIGDRRGLKTHEKLAAVNNMIAIWAEEVNALEASRKKLKRFQEQQEQLAAKGILKKEDIEEDKRDILEADERLVSEIARWKEELGDEALQIKQEFTLEVNELENAMISFEAAAAEKLSVSSGHADTFRKISDAVAAYKNVTPENESECAANLYKACRDYLHVHTVDGARQYEIGGQGTQTGRVRKAAVVKLLEIMEKRADARRTEFQDARNAYYDSYKKNNSGFLCPVLDLDALKTSLADHSKANIGPTRATGTELINLKAYAELDKVRDGYLKKQQAAQKKQAEAARKHKPKVKAPK